MMQTHAVERMQSRGGHTSEEDLDAVLLGEGSAACHEHLVACPACSARLHTVTSAVAAFNQASLGWSEAKSNTISRDLLAVEDISTRTPAGLSAAATPWYGVVVAMLVIAMILTATPHALTAHYALVPPAAQQELEDRESASQIAADDAMLRAIDSAVNTPVPSPVESYRVTEMPGVER